MSCEALEICEKGVVVGYRSSEEEWHHTIDMAGAVGLGVGAGGWGWLGLRLGLVGWMVDEA